MSMLLEFHPHGAAALLTFLALPVAAVAQTITVAVPCVADATLYAPVPLSNGGGMGVFVGVNATGLARRALLRFDVAAVLPANAVVLSTSLQFNIAQTNALTPTLATGHRVLQAWGEGTTVAPGNGGGGAPAVTGDATWLHAFYQNVLWNAAGGDFAPNPSFFVILPVGGPGATIPSSVASADVQAWLNNPAQNYGWLLKTDELTPLTACRIESRESLGQPPSLSVTYMLPGTNANWSSVPAAFTNTFVGAPIGGSSVTIAKTGAPPGSFGGDFFSFALEPVGFPLAPGSQVYLPLLQPIISGALFATDPGGNGATFLPLPPGFSGYMLNCQALVLDGSPLGFQLSNAALTVLQ